MTSEDRQRDQELQILKEENRALREAAVAFADLAERLNHRLRQARQQAAESVAKPGGAAGW
jgi:hypothetical protein